MQNNCFFCGSDTLSVSCETCQINLKNGILPKGEKKKEKKSFEEKCTNLTQVLVNQFQSMSSKELYKTLRSIISSKEEIYELFKKNLQRIEILVCIDLENEIIEMDNQFGKIPIDQKDYKFEIRVNIKEKDTNWRRALKIIREKLKFETLCNSSFFICDQNGTEIRNENNWQNFQKEMNISISNKLFIAKYKKINQSNNLIYFPRSDLYLEKGEVKSGFFSIVKKYNITEKG